MDLDLSAIREEEDGDPKPDAAPRSPVPCSICLESVLDRGGHRSVAKLLCGHQFHLDCIGSAFNAKGAMQCPNCRKVEKGHWLYANGYRSHSEFNVDEFVNEDLYDLSYSELPFGLQWCPFRGYMQLSSFFEEGDPQANAYHHLNGSTSISNHSNASSSTHVCPYLAMHGFPHFMHPTPSSSSDPVPPDASFHRHSSGPGPSSNDVLNSHGFSAAESRLHNWQQTSLPFPMSGSGSYSAEQTTSQLTSRLSRNDSAVQQRGSFVHSFPVNHGSLTRPGSNLVGSSTPPIIGDAGSHSRAHIGHMQQQSTSSSSVRNAPFAPTRRMRQRGLALISSVATNASVEGGGLYGFSPSSGSMDRSQQDGDSIGRHFDRFYGWVREGFAPLPWIPVDGEPWWWSPFHPNHNPQTGSTDSVTRNYFPQRPNADRVPQGQPENNNQRPHFPRMSHFM